MALIFDIETDGFEQDATKIHCLVVKDTETGKVYARGPEEIEAGLRELSGTDRILVGHNVIRFDIPVIKRLYPWFQIDQDKVIDTLVLSRLIYSDLRERDGGNVESGRLPTKLWASHSLKAWGYRMELLKGEYGDEEGAWDVFTPEMLEYCIRDVEVTEALYKKLTEVPYEPRAVALEHKVAWACAAMSQSGWPFDKEKAVTLYADLVAKREGIKNEMMTTFEPLVEERWSEKTGKKLKDKITEFNPGSRDQIAYRLIKKYG